MNRTEATVLLSRYIFLAGGVMGTMITIQPDRYPLFMVLTLAFIANTQIRLHLQKLPWIFCSLLLDGLLMICFLLLIKAFSGLFVLVSLSDIIFKLKMATSKLIPMIMLAGIFYAFSLMMFGSIEIIFLMVIILFISLILLLGIRRSLDRREEAEVMIDELKNTQHDLEAAKANLLEYSRQVERITKLEERNRISRDLHDTIGHSLTGILLQVDAAIQILEKDREKGMTILRSAYDNINQGIETVRKTVRRLKPTQTSDYSIDSLIEKFIEDTGIKVELKSTGNSYELLPSIKTILYRNIKEALTNSVRHGNATQIHIHLIYAPDKLEAVITDNGKGCDAIKLGFGLSGMEERLKMMDGRLEIQSKNGFELRMILPGGNNENGH